MENTNVVVEKAVTEVTPGMYEIVSHPKHKGLVGRLVNVTKGSKKPGMVNGHLIDKKSSVAQKTEISIALENLVPYVAPVAEIKEEEAPALAAQSQEPPTEEASSEQEAV